MSLITVRKTAAQTELVAADCFSASAADLPLAGSAATVDDMICGVHLLNQRIIAQGLAWCKPGTVKGSHAEARRLGEKWGTGSHRDTERTEGGPRMGCRGEACLARMARCRMPPRTERLAGSALTARPFVYFVCFVVTCLRSFPCF